VRRASELQGANHVSSLEIEPYRAFSQTVGHAERRRIGNRRLLERHRAASNDHVAQAERRWGGRDQVR
jgi:hypothetical protein